MSAKLSLKEILAARRLAEEPTNHLPSLDGLAEDHSSSLKTNEQQNPIKDESIVPSYNGAFSLAIELNQKQLMAKEFTFAGKSFVLTGAAGTGKTTAQRAVAEALLTNKQLHTTHFKLQGSKTIVQAPSIAFCAYTRRATNNLRRAIHKNPELEETLKHNIMTIHALLEFEPVFEDKEDSDGNQYKTFRFLPKRDHLHPLTITHLVIEEASMLGLDLWRQLYDALPEGIKIIFLGDINQLQPVFGPSILNYALTQLPVIELTEVYRQAGDSTILQNAHRILKGESLIEAEDFQIIRGKQKIHVGQDRQAIALGKLFNQLYESGEYSPSEDIILSPWNKQPLGTTNLNNHIAQFLGEKRSAIVYEIQAGFTKQYLAVGDSVLCNKQEGVITKISTNYEYRGVPPQLQGQDLTRFGHRIFGKEHADLMDEPGEPFTLNYENFQVTEDMEVERKIQSSHIVEVLTENGETIKLTSAGDFNPATFSLGYALTVHKAQGCEWRRVFLVLHKQHAISLHRELFYTAVTRAREKLILIAKDDVISKAISTQRIKGDSLEDKIAYFNSGLINPLIQVSCTK